MPRTMPMPVASGATLRMFAEPGDHAREHVAALLVEPEPVRSEDGAADVPAPSESLIGSCGTIASLKSAQKIQNSTMATPIRNAGDCSSCLIVSRRTRDLESSEVSARGDLGRRDDRDVGRAHERLPEAHARIERGREDVAEQRRREVDDADDEDAGLQHREVLDLRGTQDELADARVAEELLDRDEAAEEVAGLRRHHRDRRQDRVADHVAADDEVARHALERRRARVVGRERLDRPGARDPRDVAEEHERDRDRGQEERVDARQQRRRRAASPRSPGTT